MTKKDSQSGDWRVETLSRLRALIEETRLTRGYAAFWLNLRRSAEFRGRLVGDRPPHPRRPRLASAIARCTRRTSSRQRDHTDRFTFFIVEHQGAARRW